MDGEIAKLSSGVVLFGVAALVLLGSLLSAIDLPIVTFVLIPLGLFGGLYLIGISYPERTI